MNSKASDPVAEFETEKLRNIADYPADREWQSLSRAWMHRAFERRYMYNFSSLGRPIIQTPTDMAAIHELIWSVKPDLVIETGIAHGGSLIFSAATLALIDYCEAVEKGVPLDPRRARRRVLGIDIDIRAHNRAAIEAHPMAHRITMLQGSAVAPDMVRQVHAFARDYSRIMLCLDSNHTHEHVLKELEAYAPLVSPGSYCVVFDTIVEDMPDDTFPDRPWSKGDNPKTAVWQYLKQIEANAQPAVDGARLRFEIDRTVEGKLLTTVAPDGYLKRIT